MPRIPLIEDLTTGTVPAGSNLLVEYDPASQWYNASTTVAAGWLRTGGKVSYSTLAQAPDTIRSRLNRLGLDAKDFESSDRFWFIDYYTHTLGRKSKEEEAMESLKVADLSIEFSTELKATELLEYPNVLRMMDDFSTLTRFNDENSCVEFALARLIPSSSIWKTTSISGIIRGVHSDWVYKRLEAVADGIIDFKLDEASNPPSNLMRIRSLRNVGYDGRWHVVKVAENFEVTLEK